MLQPQCCWKLLLGKSGAATTVLLEIVVGKVADKSCSLIVFVAVLIELDWFSKTGDACNSILSSSS